jgi:hypothetical protein
MSIDLVSTSIDVEAKQEHVVLMDDYGASFHLYIPVSAGASRQTLINAKVVLMQANQTNMESYAAANSIDLSAQKTAGAAKKQALLAKAAPTVAAAMKATTAAAQAASAPASSASAVNSSQPAQPAAANSAAAAPAVAPPATKPA